MKASDLMIGFKYIPQIVLKAYLKQLEDLYGKVKL